jgi:environmental stress-induced protein Ves
MSLSWLVQLSAQRCSSPVSLLAMALLTSCSGHSTAFHIQGRDGCAVLCIEALQMGMTTHTEAYMLQKYVYACQQGMDAFKLSLYAAHRLALF